MNLLPSTLIFIPSLLVAVPMPLDQEGSTYIRGYNYKVSDAPIDQSIYESHENHLQIPRSDGSRINFSRYYDSPGLPKPAAPPLDAVVVEAKVFVKVVTYICQVSRAIRRIHGTQARSHPLPAAVPTSKRATSCCTTVRTTVNLSKRRRATSSIEF